MKSLLAFGLGLIGALFGVCQAAPLYQTFDVPGIPGASVYPLSINDSGTVTGYYISGNSRFGFVRSNDGTLTSFGGSSNAEATAINNAGTVVGYTGSSQGFVRTPDGTITTYNVPDADGSYVNTFIEAENDSGDFAGTFAGASLGSGAFIHSSNGTLTIIPSPALEVTGLNTSGTLVGSLYDAAARNSSGYIHSLTGSETFVAPPSAGQKPPAIEKGSYTFAQAINSTGTVTGFAFQRFCTPKQNPCYYRDVRSFIRSPEGNFIVFQVEPQRGVTTTGSGTYAVAINNDGAVTGTYNLTHGFIRNSSNTVTTFDVPAMQQTSAVSINNLGAVVGSCVDAAGVVHGYLRQP